MLSRPRTSAKTLVVGVADCKASDQSEIEIVTYGLGSCVAVTAYDPIRRVGGMAHYMLPDSKIDPVQAESKPFMFADTALPRLFEAVLRLGADKSRLFVSVTGGARAVGAETGVGNRNRLAAKKLLWRAGILVSRELTGGSDPRQVRLRLRDGHLDVRVASSEGERLTRRRA